MNLAEFFLGRLKESLDTSYSFVQDVISEFDGDDVDLDELEELEGAIAEALKMARALVLPEVCHDA